MAAAAPAVAPPRQLGLMLLLVLLACPSICKVVRCGRLPAGYSDVRNRLAHEHVVQSCYSKCCLEAAAPSTLTLKSNVHGLLFVYSPIGKCAHHHLLALHTCFLKAALYLALE